MSRALVRPILIGAGLAALLVTASLTLYWWFAPAAEDPLLATLDAAAVIAAPTATVTTTTTTTTTPAPTTTSTEPEPEPFFETTLCVVGLDPGETVPVHIGPGTDYTLVAGIPYDGVEIGFTGAAAADSDGMNWIEIRHDGAAGWAMGTSFTHGPCTTEPITTYSVVDIPCKSNLNVRNGIGGQFARLGTLQPTDDDVAGTGYSAIDDQDRRWIRVEYEGRIAWVAGWYLTAETLDPGRCG